MDIFRYPKPHNQCLGKGQLPELVTTQWQFQHKVLLGVWWNYEEVIHHKLVLESQNIDANLNSQLLEQMYAIVAKIACIGLQKVSFSATRKKKAQTTRNKLLELEGIELMPPPEKNANLVPSDFYIFGSIARGGSINKGKRKIS